MTPVSLEEQIICFADKFFSKSKLDHEKELKKPEKVLHDMAKRVVNVLTIGANSFYSLKNKLKTVALVFI